MQMKRRKNNESKGEIYYDEDRRNKNSKSQSKT